MPDRNIEQGVNSQYFESNNGIINIYAADKDKIIEAISEWHTQHNRKQLYILVLCSTQIEIEQNENLQNISNLYGEKPANWQPYKNNEITKNIAELLEEYHKFTNISIKGWFLNAFDWADDDEKIDDLRDSWAKKMILITDGIAILKPENIVIKDIFNNQENIGGFMLPLCEKMNETAKNYINLQVLTQLKTTHRRFYKSWRTAFFHIELEIPNKDLFFRRLTNLANRMEIMSSASVLEFEKVRTEKKSLANLTND
jgi:hypothetical protein